ncbi:hypothetical protein TB2_034627 [Malus domestica]
MINLEEVAVEANCREEITRQSHSLSSLFRSPSGYSAQVIPITTTPPNESTEIWVGGELIPQDAWLPITESRNGNVFSATFHLLCSGIGVQSLLLPLAFATVGW